MDKKCSECGEIKDIKEFYIRKKEIAKYADVREFLDLIATSHSNLIYRWCNVSYTDSADVVIPYMVLKQYSNNRFN